MQSPVNVFGSVQDEGTMSGTVTNTFGTKPDTTLRPWRMAPGGEGTQIQVDPLNTNIVYSSTYYGRLMKTDMSKSRRDAVQRFSLFDVGRIDSLRGEWLAATVMSKFNNKVIYHGLQHLYKTEDAGETWKKISNDLSYNRKERNGVYPYLIYHQAITAVAEGNKYFSKEINILDTNQDFRNTVTIEDKKVDEILSKREIEVLTLICKEYSNSEIAKKLFLSVSTVETHRKNLIAKLGVNNTVGLVKFALKNKLIE